MKSNRAFRNILIATSGLAALGGAGQAWSQVVQASPNTSAANPSTVQEVIVTAERREERVMDVPVSVSAFAGKALQQMGVLEPTDLQNIVPALQYINAGPIPKLGIRGITLNDFGDSNESPVAFYMDDVYIASPAAPLGQFFDVNRIEVLEGPQGTLFGRNAEGGLLQVISNKPTHDFSGDASFQYGSFNQTIFDGAVSLPLTDAIRTRSALYYNRDDGWQADPITQTRGGKTDIVAFREIIDIDFAPHWTNELIGSYSKADDVDPELGARGVFNPTTGAMCSTQQIFANICVDNVGNNFPHPKPNVVYSELGDLPTHIENEGVSDTIHYASSLFNFTSISAYHETNKLHDFDEGGSGYPLGGFLVYRADRTQVSQEFRFDGQSGPLKWVAGTYFFDEHLDHGQVTLPLLVDLIGPDGLQTNFRTNTFSIAGFGQVSYDITPAITLTGGLRYSSEVKKIDLSDDFAAPDFYNRYRATTDKLNYKAGVEWRFMPHLMTYANVSTGLRVRLSTRASSPLVALRLLKRKRSQPTRSASRAKPPTTNFNLPLPVITTAMTTFS